LLVRSISKNWGKGSVLAVDAGIHLASIARILEKEQGNENVKDDQEPPAKRKGPRKAINGEEGNQAHTSNGTKKNFSISTLDAFNGLQLPHKSSRANAAYVTRELVSTYLITHPHLDHISGFVINTASFQHTSRPKRLAALSTTIDAIKTHIFNDVIWPNMVSPSSHTAVSI
jgi:cAMP phosphodiesterase